MKFNFFYMDEWDWLIEIKHGTYGIFTPHNEHFLPIMRIFYLTEIKILGANPHLLHYVMLLLHTSVSFLLGHLIWLLFKENKLVVVGTLIFLLHPLQDENVLWTFQSQILLNVGFFIVSLTCLKLFFDNKKKIYYYFSIIFAIIQSYCFGNGLILPLVVVFFFLLFRNKKVTIYYCLPYILIFLMNLMFYKIFGSINIHANMGSLSKADIPSILDYFSNAVFYNITRSIIPIGVPRFFVTLFLYTIIIAIVLIAVIKDCTRDRGIRRILVFSSIFYPLCFVLISLTRFRTGYLQSFSPRYAYFYLIPGILIFLALIKYFFLITKKERLYKIVLVLLITLYSMSSIYIISHRKAGIEARDRNNFQELLHYNMDKTYEPDLSQMHPFRSKEVLLETANAFKLLNR